MTFKNQTKIKLIHYKKQPDFDFEEERLLINYRAFISFTLFAPPTIVEGHYVFWSVRPSICSSVRPFVPLQVKVFGQVSF